MSNAQLEKTIVHVDEASTTSDLLARNLSLLALVLAIAASSAAAWVAMLPGATADIARSTMSQDSQQSSTGLVEVNAAGDVVAPTLGAAAATDVQLDPATAAVLGSPFAVNSTTWIPAADGTQVAVIDGVRTVVAAA